MRVGTVGKALEAMDLAKEYLNYYFDERVGDFENWTGMYWCIKNGRLWTKYTEPTTKFSDMVSWDDSFPLNGEINEKSSYSLVKIVNGAIYTTVLLHNKRRVRR